MILTLGWSDRGPRAQARPVVGMASSGNYYIWVAPGLANEAKSILSESSISDAELTAQALADSPPDDT